MYKPFGHESGTRGNVQNAKGLGNRKQEKIFILVVFFAWEGKFYLVGSAGGNVRGSLNRLG